MSSKVTNWLALDKRSLGLFRIAVGVSLILDVASRGLFFRAHYSSQGLFPLKDYLVQPGVDMRRWSLLFMNDTPLFVGLFFLATLVFSVLFTLGYRTRLTGWICWALLVSIFRRNPLVVNAGDMYLPLLLFWGNFLPWGDRFSVQSRANEDSDVGGFPAFCYQIQVCILYWFSAIFRAGPEWQVDYSALYHAMKAERFNTFLSPWLLTLGTDLLAALTYVTLALELLGPFFLLLPLWRVRAVCVLLIMSFHFGIMLGINIPIFALIGIVGPLGMLPGQFWELKGPKKFERWFSRSISGWGSRRRLSESRSETDTVGKLKLELLYRWLTYPAMALMLFGLYRGVYNPESNSYVLGLSRVFSLDQRWGMFSPRPPHYADWDTAPATTSSGRKIDLLTGGEYDPSASTTRFYQRFGNVRWFNLHMILMGEMRGHNQFYLQYLVDRWNEAHPDDPVLTARYEYHFQTIMPHYLLGETRTKVYATFP